jgi:tetratricopeptide (TPR) repeat protein
MRRVLFGMIFLAFAVFVPEAVPAPMSGAEAAARFNKAGVLYREGGFREALESYEAIIADGVRNPDLYYNAAGAAYRSEMIGKSILYLERALKLAPSDRDILANLAFVNSRKQDRDPVEDNVVLAFLERRYGAVTGNAAALWSGGAFALMMLLGAAILFSGGWKRMSLAVFAAICGLVFLTSAGVLVHKAHKAAVSREAVVMTGELNAYSGPGTDNTLIFTIHEGAKVFLERSQDSWVLVRLKSGAGGWVEAKALEKI